MPELVLVQQNPTLDKIALRLNLAGASSDAPILSGLGARLTLTLHSGERLRRVRVWNDDGFSQLLTMTGSGTQRTTDVVFGTHTDSGVTATKNYLDVVTNRGTSRRQFWVKDLPSEGAVYINNQEAQRQIPVVWVALSSTEYLDRCATTSFNILPHFNDEFFNQQWYSANAWANTLRTWGGAATCEVFTNDGLIISERDVADIHGYFWIEPAYRIYTVRFRLRASEASETYVDIDGRIQVKMIPCP